MQTDVSDEMLLIDLKNGSCCAFEAIYLRYWRQLYAFVFQQVGSKEEAEEILQDLMLSLWQHRRESRIHNLKAFLFISARNQVNMHIRREINLRKYRAYELMREMYENIEAEYLLDEKQLLEAIDRALEKLPEKTANIFRMNKIDDISIAVIASQMGLSDKAVEYHLTKSMKVVRMHLGEFRSYN